MSSTTKVALFTGSEKQQRQSTESDNLVSLVEFKKAMAEKLPNNYSVRDLILTSPDQMTWEEFKIKAEIWQQLLQLDMKKDSPLTVIK